MIRPYGVVRDAHEMCRPLKTPLASAKVSVPNAKVYLSILKARTLTQEGVQQLLNKADFIL